MSANKDCSQCKGCGRVADVAAHPKPAWTDWENRPRHGPDPMTDFVQPVPCPTCFPKPEEQVTELRRLKEEAVDRNDFETAARIRDQIDELTPDSPAVSFKPEPESPNVFRGKGCDIVVLTVAQGLRTKAVGYRKRAETLEGLATVAEGLTPGSDAERAFLDFIKTQGVDL